ncbi:hypothetical protein K438DRAFT_1255504 [Mycena galopus ATCC 62051]|nr:hypothetical protein K438DRAFT_1255504 [Mycena galopus ATCC 62051]
MFGWRLCITYSTIELMQEVKPVVSGPAAWTATSSRPPAARQRIHASIPGPRSLTASDPILLSGDTHLLVTRGTGCEIWDISENRRVWARDGVQRNRMLVHPVQNGTELFISLWDAPHIRCSDYRPQIHGLQNRCANSCSRLENSERPLLPIRLPRNFTKFSEVVVAEDFWSAHVEWYSYGATRHSGILIVNWREHIFVLFEGSLGHKPSSGRPRSRMLSCILGQNSRHIGSS